MGRATALGIAWGATARGLHAAPAWPSSPLVAIPPRAAALGKGARPLIVSFHVDRPYVDRSGCAEPYRPPAGTRSGAGAADLSETDFRRRHPYG